MLLLSRSSGQEEQIMSQPRTITPFMAATPGVDHRILGDVGLDAEGNPVDKDDPRIRRQATGGSLMARMPKFLSMPGKMLHDQPQAASRF
jgi:hypothetical protein